MPPNYDFFFLPSRNLSRNNLKVWNAHNSSMQLPSLITIDAHGNMGWRPSDKYLLELPRLKEVMNVSWAAECIDCLLVKSFDEDTVKIYNVSRVNVTNSITCITKYYTLSHFLVLLARNRFLVRKCRNQSACILEKETNNTEFHSCWHVTQRAIYGQVLLGTLGGCLNLVVFFNILLTKSLRKNVSLVLVSNLALGDALTCIYSVAIANFILRYQYLDWRDLFDSICPKVGFLWVLGQCTTSIISVALTVDRYLCIVFSMKPDIRITPRLAALTIVFNWLLAASLMFVGHYFKMFRKTYLCLPISFQQHFPSETVYTLALGSTGITLYLSTIPMYVHIYRVVKRSSQQMGVKRESTLAKRIALLVMSNLVFFFIPVLALSVWIIFVGNSRDDLLSFYARSAIQDLIPLYCLSINSCLNPLVHALRNDKFKTALKKNLSVTGYTNHVTLSNRGHTNHVTSTGNSKHVISPGSTNRVASTATASTNHVTSIGNVNHVTLTSKQTK